MVASPIEEEKILPSLKRHPWADNFFRPLLLVIMVMCFSLSLVNLTRLFNPAWRGAFFLLGMLLTTVEAIYSYRLLKSWRARDISVMRYRTAEWVSLLVALKIFSLADKTLAQVMIDFQSMWQDPLNVVNVEFYMMLILAAVCWWMVTDTVTDFDDLHDPYALSASTISPVDRLATRFMWGGVILVLTSGINQLIIRFGLPGLIDFQRPSLDGILVNVLVYFVVGLALLSQARLTRLMMTWQLHKVEIGPGLVKQWAKYGLVFLGLVTAAAFFLPTTYTLGFLTSAAVVLGAIMQYLIFVAQLVLMLLSLPLAWLWSLLGMKSRSADMPPAPAPAEIPKTVPGGASYPWLEALRSLVFWLVALIIVGYLLKIYVSDRRELLAALNNLKPLAVIINLLKGLWAYARGIARSGADFVAASFKLSGRKEGGAVVTDWSWFGLARLSSRERILYYYLNILQRAERRRLARRRQHTPYADEPTLEQAVPDVETDIHALTDIFVRARYSLEGFSEEQATLVKQQWQHIRRALGRSSKH